MANEYRERFKLVFGMDAAFSKLFAAHADEISMRNFVTIRNHEKRMTAKDCETDAQSIDRTYEFQKITMGIRVRREKYATFGDFTMDTKEWNNACNGQLATYYLGGYGDETTKRLSFFMLWDHKEFIKLVKANTIKREFCENKTHSLVPFWAFKYADIFDKCTVIDCSGTADMIRKVLDDRKVTHELKLGVFG